MADKNPDLADSHESDDDGSTIQVEEPRVSKKPKTKPRASRAGTRSVASLTPEQLVRKRANDREAQRNIRQRTKDYIEGLERRIQELSGDRQDDDTLEKVQRRNKELEEEIERLRDLLDRSAGSMTSPTSMNSISNYGINTLEDLSAPSFSSSFSSQDPNIGHSGLHGALRASTGELWPTAPAYSTSASAYSTTASTRSGSFSSERSFVDSSISSRPLVPLLTSQTSTSNQRPQFGRSSISSPYRQPEQLSSTMAQASTSPFSNEGFPTIRPPGMTPPVPDHTTQAPGSGSYTPIVPGYAPPLSSVNQESRREWDFPLRSLPPTCPLDDILFGVIQRQRGLALAGADENTVVGSESPSLKAILNPDESNSVHNITGVISSLLHRTVLSGLPEKIGALIIIQRLVQWQISPSPATYHNIPEWYRPRTSQIYTPHPIWMDLILWGELRDVLIENQEKYNAEEFQHIYGISINTNWPYRNIDVMVLEGSEVVVSDAFAAHIAVLSNWSLNEDFQRRYPELVDACKFT